MVELDAWVLVASRGLLPACADQCHGPRPRPAGQDAGELRLLDACLTVGAITPPAATSLSRIAWCAISTPSCSARAQNPSSGDSAMAVSGQGDAPSALGSPSRSPRDATRSGRASAETRA